MTIIDYARKLRPIIEQAMKSVDDTIALEAAELFPKWKEGMVYTAGERLQYDGTLYKVLQAHTSQADWAPDVAVSLFARVLIPDEETVYPWEQPESTNPYMRGDKVLHNGKIWISIIDHNVWEPGVCGWEEEGNAL